MKFSQMKKVSAMILTVAITLGGNLISYADWKQDGLGWWYEQADGSYPVSTWYEDTDGSWYFFNENGYMISNCYRSIDSNIYAFGYNGKWTGTMFSDLQPGVWAGNNYSNEWSGFHLNIPEGYRIELASDTGTIENVETFVEFVVWAPDGSGSAIELEYADAYDYTNGTATTPEYVALMHGLRLSLEGYSIEGITNVQLGGNEYAKLSTRRHSMQKRELYCRKVGEHYFECVSVIYWPTGEAAINGLLSSIY